jgi:hypothetical protein
MAESTDEYRKMLKEQEEDMKKNPEKYFVPTSEKYPGAIVGFIEKNSESEEFKKNRQKQIDAGEYLDDGCVPMPCKHCGTMRPILSIADCCEKAKKEQDERMRSTMDSVINALGKDD